MKRLVMATNNADKRHEVRQMLDGKYEICSLADIGCHEDIPETADTLEGNALQKMRYVRERYRIDCFADDTGLEVEALDGEPGVFTARYGMLNGYGESHDAQANIRCLLDKLKDATTRRAQFHTVVALCLNGEEHVFHGIVKGEILQEQVGGKGFGYDPVFAPDEADGLAFAQMDLDAKNAISHRGRAIARLARFLSEQA
ncbi:MAG: RdgB/HAM1 family non-canonical purine NTP pyrophosphatase [Bacteroidaceae bacterium]